MLVAKLLLALLSVASCGLLLTHATIGTVPAEVLMLLGVITSVAFFSPQGALFLLLLAGPVAGNRPGSTQAEMLLLLSAALQVGSSRFLLANLDSLKSIVDSRLMVLLACYGGASVLSLTGISPYEWTHELYRYTPSLFSGEPMLYLLRALSRATEERPLYVVLSVLWTLYSFYFAVLAFLLVRATSATGTRILGVISASLILSLVVGLADYYGAIDLRGLRSLDPTVNPDDVQFRLQSWFGHSGWFAEFVTLAIPSTMVLLLAPLPFGVRVGGLILVLLLGEFALILTFQRGGWLSYPLTLFVVWAAIYVTRKLERGESSIPKALQSSLVKIMVTLPLTVVLSLGLLWIANHNGWLASSAPVDLSVYVGRAKDITKASDRTEFLRAGTMLGLRQPILGGGSESFAYQFEKEFEHPQGAFSGAISLPLHGTAHNLYVQTFAGKGLVGVGLLVALLLTLIGAPLRAVLSGEQSSHHAVARSPEGRLVLLSCAASGAAVMIYGNVQEVFYIQGLQYLVFILCGVAGGLLTSPSSPQSVQRARRWAGFLLAAGLLQLVWLYVVPGTKAASSLTPPLYGCYAREHDSSGEFRWCGPRAREEFAVQALPSGGRGVVLEVEAVPSVRGAATAALIVSHAGQKVASLPLEPGKRANLAIPLSVESERAALEFRIGAGIIPARDLAPSQDYRYLSFKLRGDG